MIPKASQRGGGKDLATHLMNAFDNEYVELAEVSGAVAQDLHGAFAEWEAVAHGLTKCRNYLYSLSINPDPAGGGLTRAQYGDYLDRVEKALGLEGQPRALLFHIKDGREHCHCVWSRIDYREEKAIHIAFDREKLMMVTRQFAREHGLSLPDGYGPGRFDERRQKTTLYDRVQERATGLTKEERQLLVTQAWRQSDSPRAFVRALEDMGYILATGERPYVLVDIYGGMNALPRMINDKSVRTKDIRAFLEREFPPEALPTVEEARMLVAQHRKAREQFAKVRDDDKRRVHLERMQAARREKMEEERRALFARQEQERAALAREQAAARQGLRAGYLAEVARVKQQRIEARPTGLAAFLGRVTGMNAVIHRVQRYKDAKKYLAFREEKQALAGTQRVASIALQRRQELQALDIARQVKALGLVERRERQALDVKRLREQRIIERQGHLHMPAIDRELAPGGRRATVRKAINRYRDPLREREERLKKGEGRADVNALREAMERALPGAARSEIDLRGAFTRAAEDERGEEESGGSASDGAPKVSRSGRKSERGWSRGRKARDDFDRER